MYECLSTIFVFVLILELFSIFWNSCLIISIHLLLLCKINFMSSWFYVFKNMSHYGPRICTVYLDIFCMYVNKCCFDAMFFSLESLPTRLSLSQWLDRYYSMCLYCVKFSPSWWFEFLFNCWSKQLQTGPSSSGLIQIDGFGGPPLNGHNSITTFRGVNK